MKIPKFPVAWSWFVVKFQNCQLNDKDGRFCGQDNLREETDDGPIGMKTYINHKMVWLLRLKIKSGFISLVLTQILLVRLASSSIFLSVTHQVSGGLIEFSLPTEHFTSHRL